MSDHDPPVSAPVPTHRCPHCDYLRSETVPCKCGKLLVTPPAAPSRPPPCEGWVCRTCWARNPQLSHPVQHCGHLALYEGSQTALVSTRRLNLVLLQQVSDLEARYAALQGEHARLKEKHADDRELLSRLRTLVEAERDAARAEADQWAVDSERAEAKLEALRGAPARWRAAFRARAEQTRAVSARFKMMTEDRDDLNPAQREDLKMSAWIARCEAAIWEEARDLLAEPSLK